MRYKTGHSATEHCTQPELCFDKNYLTVAMIRKSVNLLKGISVPKEFIFVHPENVKDFKDLLLGG